MSKDQDRTYNCPVLQIGKDTFIKSVNGYQSPNETYASYETITVESAVGRKYDKVISCKLVEDKVKKQTESAEGIILLYTNVVVKEPYQNGFIEYEGTVVQAVLATPFIKEHPKYIYSIAITDL